MEDDQKVKELQEKVGDIHLTIPPAIETPEGVNETRICILGNVDSGKSTLVSVLTNFQLDDGNGSARAHVLNYKHEISTGRSSSIQTQILGFSKGEQVKPNKPRDQVSVAQCSEKFVTLVDLCGHEKYLKTTMSGLTGSHPDYAMLVIGANAGFQRITKEHLGVAVALKVFYNKVRFQSLL